MPGNQRLAGTTPWSAQGEGHSSQPAAATLLDFCSCLSPHSKITGGLEGLWLKHVLSSPSLLTGLSSPDAVFIRPAIDREATEPRHTQGTGSARRHPASFHGRRSGSGTASDPVLEAVLQKWHDDDEIFCAACGGRRTEYSATRDRPPLDLCCDANPVMAGSDSTDHTTRELQGPDLFDESLYGNLHKSASPRSMRLNQVVESGEIYDGGQMVIDHEDEQLSGAEGPCSRLRLPEVHDFQFAVPTRSTQGTRAIFGYGRVHSDYSHKRAGGKARSGVSSAASLREAVCTAAPSPISTSPGWCDLYTLSGQRAVETREPHTERLSPPWVITRPKAYRPSTIFTASSIGPARGPSQIASSSCDIFTQFAAGRSAASGPSPPCSPRRRSSFCSSTSPTTRRVDQYSVMLPQQLNSLEACHAAHPLELLRQPASQQLHGSWARVADVAAYVPKETYGHEQQATRTLSSAARSLQQPNFNRSTLDDDHLSSHTQHKPHSHRAEYKTFHSAAGQRSNTASKPAMKRPAVHRAAAVGGSPAANEPMTAEEQNEVKKMRKREYARNRYYEQQAFRNALSGQINGLKTECADLRKEIDQLQDKREALNCREQELKSVFRILSMENRNLKKSMTARGIAVAAN